MHLGIRVALVGDFNEQQKAHVAIPKSLISTSGGAVESVWVPTDSIGKVDSLAEFDGIWCVPGMPYRSADGAMAAIRFARMSRTPFLGTSAGFQYALIEYARNVLGFKDADHQKSNPKSSMPLITPLGCALMGMRARVRLIDGSHLRRAYRVPESMEYYHCSFGLNNRYRRLIDGGHLYIAAVDDQQDVRAIELDGHPFYVAALFQPEMAEAPSPLIGAFLTACERRHQGATKAAS